MSGACEISSENLLNGKGKSSSNIPLFIMLTLALCMILYTYFFSFVRVDGKSMQNTLQPDQFVFFANHGYTVKRGDIITIDNKIRGKLVIKRAIALEGDRVLFMKSADGFVDLYLCQNGQTHFTLADEPYIAERMRCDGKEFASLWSNVSLAENYTEITNLNVAATTDEYELHIINDIAIEIPKNGVFFLGDNRNDSGDSREDGVLYLSDVKGKMLKPIDMDSTFGKFLEFLY